MTRLIIGIDPGLTGAIAAITHSGTLVAVIDMPTMTIGRGAGKIKRQIDTAGLATILRHLMAGQSDEAMVITEKVAAMPAQGVSSVFSLGDSAGAIRGVVATLGVPLSLVTPASWKKHFKLGSDKELARARAILLYPGADLTRKKDHNRAEAILLARYGLEVMV